MIPQILFLLGVGFAASGWASPPVALALGLAFGLLFRNPFAESAAKYSKILLQASVVGLGFGIFTERPAQACVSHFYRHCHLRR